jgi:hypothetical protein
MQHVSSLVVWIARVRRAAGVLMLPYLASLAYADVLNLWVRRATAALLGT